MVQQRFATDGYERPPLTFRAFRTLLTFCSSVLLVLTMTVSSGLLSMSNSVLLLRGTEFVATTAALAAWIWSTTWYSGRPRPWRVWMCLSVGCFQVGQVAWLWAQLDGQGIELELTASTAFVLTAVLALVAVTVHAFEQPNRRPRERTTNIRMVATLDLLIVVASMLLFVLITLGRQLEDAWDSSELIRIAVVVQPLTYLVLVATIVVLARFRPGVRDLPVLFLSLGIIAFLLSSTVFARSTDWQLLSIAPWMEAWFVTCPVFFFLAALAPIGADEAPGTRIRLTTREIALLALPYLPLIVSIVFAAASTVSGRLMPHRQEVALLVLMCLVVLRQLVTLAENLRLLRSAEHEALHDPLTGLANRTLFLDDLDRSVQHRSAQLVLVFCDMDDFKEINDSYGHLAGDQVLASTARQLERCVQEQDTVARLGGDEFAILLRDPREPLSAIEHRLLRALQEPHMLGGEPRVVSASVGVTSLTSDVSITDTDELMHWADTAMYTAKRRGKNTLAHVPEPREQPVR